ncbi:hypothetical protein SAMN05446037_100269 [Anaerovirgula multivorans]|uniref:Phage gp6-like head-tail connector protein n=1 Tax=Anaerovirgula multivorans TaxID=312168 RepID=A0A239AIQ1_9FIRM|nr:phage head-tail connector protein [Anaerovirgula multivorans]SNR95525.1 hypothetical protein SAMN05446037_100269 [Anaerovirgula multivorans]
MTDEQIKDALTDWVKDYCNNDFIEDEVEVLPGGVLLFLNQAVEFTKKQTGITSESLGDYSVSFETDFPASMLKLLSPYKRVKFL